MGVFCIQRTGKPCGASSVYTSDKMDRPGHRLSPHEELSQNGRDGKRKRETAYFYSVHPLPQPFLPFPLLPSTASPQYKHAAA